MEPAFDDKQLKNLSAFMEIDTEKDWKSVSKRMGFGPRRLFRPIWWAAASIILLLGIGGLSLGLFTQNPTMLVHHSSSAQEQLVLPDGTLVSLNASSSLSWPESFGRNARKVQLEGEAFFTVKRDEDRPFLVNVAEQAQVEVLGTRFSVRSEEDMITVLVEEGKVAFSPMTKNSSKIILEKQQQAVLSGTRISRTSFDANQISWHTGTLHFEETPLKDVLISLSRHFGRKIIPGEGIDKELKLTSTYHEESLESILEEITLVLNLKVESGNEHIILKMTTIPEEK